MKLRHATTFEGKGEEANLLEIIKERIR